MLASGLLARASNFLPPTGNTGKRQPLPFLAGLGFHFTPGGLVIIVIIGGGRVWGFTGIILVVVVVVVILPAVVGAIRGVACVCATGVAGTCMTLRIKVFWERRVFLLAQAEACTRGSQWRIVGVGRDHDGCGYPRTQARSILRRG